MVGKYILFVSSPWFRRQSPFFRLTSGKSSRLARKIVAAGLGLLVLGFIALSMVNRMATNWAGFLSPVLLVSGWIVIAVGLWKSEK